MSTTVAFGSRFIIRGIWCKVPQLATETSFIA